jgi:hypothetical protein
MRTAARFLLLCFVLTAPFHLIAGNQASANVAGKWTITIRMPGQAVSEQWTVQQKGNLVTGIARGERGELQVSGTIDGAFFRVAVKDGEKQYKVRATVDGDQMDGSITFGVGDSHLWFAKRSTGSTSSRSGR